MTPLDWGLVIVWGGIALSGFWKGAVKLIFGFGGLLFGLWLSFSAGPDLGAALSAHVQPVWAASILGFLLPVLCCVFLFWLAGWGIERTLKALHLGWANRLLGAGLAAVVGGVLLGLLLVVSLGLSPGWAEMCRESLLFPYLVDLAELVFGKV